MKPTTVNSSVVQDRSFSLELDNLFDQLTGQAITPQLMAEAKLSLVKILRKYKVKATSNEPITLILNDDNVIEIFMHDIEGN